jgi:hypothetical protein
VTSRERQKKQCGCRGCTKRRPGFIFVCFVYFVVILNRSSADSQPRNTRNTRKTLRESFFRLKLEADGRVNHHAQAASRKGLLDNSFVTPSRPLSNAARLPGADQFQHFFPTGGTERRIGLIFVCFVYFVVILIDGH